jgi:hypothetical protein
VTRALTLEEICATKWGEDRRAVTAAMKAQVFRSYGLSGNQDAACKPSGCEITGPSARPEERTACCSEWAP